MAIEHFHRHDGSCLSLQGFSLEHTNSLFGGLESWEGTIFDLLILATAQNFERFWSWTIHTFLEKSVTWFGSFWWMD